MTANYDDPLATRVLGIDPGETTGWAYLAGQGIPVADTRNRLHMGQVKGLDRLIPFLEGLDPVPTVIVFERYVIEELTRNQNSGEIETIQAIGVIKSYALRNRIKIVGQLRNVKPQDYAWHPTVRSPGAKENSHRRDAHAHAVYYLVMNKLMKIQRRN